jgi:hypothetical protein
MAAIETSVSLKSAIPDLRGRVSDKTERGILRGSLRKTARSVLVKAAKNNLRLANGRRFVKDLTVKTKVTAKVAFALVGAKKGSTLSKIGHLFEGGTKPHIVRARRKKAMVTRDGIFIGKRANHPGTQAKPWLNPALKDNRTKALMVFGQNLLIEFDRAIAKGKR